MCRSHITGAMLDLPAVSHQTIDLTEPYDPAGMPVAFRSSRFIHHTPAVYDYGSGTPVEMLSSEDAFSLAANHEKWCEIETWYVRQKTCLHDICMCMRDHTNIVVYITHNRSITMV